jgi:hypothetical protein
MITASRNCTLPAGFAFDLESRLFLASGIGPDGQGDDNKRAFAKNLLPIPTFRVDDPELSPLDQAIAPMAMLSFPASIRLVRQMTTVREYDALDEQLVRALFAGETGEFSDPRGLHALARSCGTHGSTGTH